MPEALLGLEDVASAEAATVCQQRAVLPEQEPRVGAERSMKPDGVRRDGGGEPRAVASMTDAVHWPKRSADERGVEELFRARYLLPVPGTGGLSRWPRAGY